MSLLENCKETLELRLAQAPCATSQRSNGAEGTPVMECWGPRDAQVCWVLWTQESSCPGLALANPPFIAMFRAQMGSAGRHCCLSMGLVRGWMSRQVCLVSPLSSSCSLSFSLLWSHSTQARQHPGSFWSPRGHGGSHSLNPARTL